MPGINTSQSHVNQNFSSSQPITKQHIPGVSKKTELAFIPFAGKNLDKKSTMAILCRVCRDKSQSMKAQYIPQPVTLEQKPGQNTRSWKLLDRLSETQCSDNHDAHQINIQIKPTMEGFLVIDRGADLKNNPGKSARLITPHDVQIFSLYQEAVFKNYKKLGLNKMDKHPDIANKSVTEAQHPHPNNVSPLEVFAKAAALGIVDEIRGQEEPGQPKLSYSYSKNSNGQINGIGAFGPLAPFNGRPSQHLAQLGNNEPKKGLGYAHVSEILKHLRAEHSQLFNFFVGTRKHNLPAEKLYLKKLGMAPMPDNLTEEILNLPTRHKEPHEHLTKYRGFATLIEPGSTEK